MLSEDTQNASPPAVLVVIVNYRTTRLTIDSLRSLAPEVTARPATQVVVVDNDSQDGSAEALAAAIRDEGWGAWATLLPSNHNGGYAYGNNLAIRPALQSEHPPRYFLLLNPDTLVRPGAIQALVDFMEPRPEVGITGSSLLNPDGSDWATAFRFPTLLSELENGVRLKYLTRLLNHWVVPRKMGDTPEQVDWVPGASMMVRREVFESVGLMDEKYFLYYEETDFLLQAQRAGWTCWYVPQSKVMHIAGQSTGVTDRSAPPRRRPQYVFDSRQRYFVKNHGWLYAGLVDLAWTFGFASWRVRHVLQRKPDEDPPHLLIDTLRNAVWMRLLKRQSA